MADMQVVGRSVARKDAPSKAAGQARYVADLALENALHGVLVRSQQHHARILSIDTTAASRLPGVVKIARFEDIPGERLFGPMVKDKPVLAHDVVRHLGEPIALVIAETRQIALQALALVEVEYDRLPAVFDPLKALEDDAPVLHPDGNLLTQYDFGSSDGAKASWDASEIVLEHTFFLPRISPAYLELEAATATWNPDETLTVWASTQMPFDDRRDIAAVLSMPEEKIEVVVESIGGSFGGKQDASLAILAALGAYLTQRPVKLVNTREESMLAHPKRHPAVLHYRLGAKRDGTLMALHVDAVIDTGAYASYGPVVGGILTEMATGPYRFQSAEVHTKVAYTNSPIAGVIRGVGGPQASFAIESMMDILADKLGIDPVDLRHKNTLQQGEWTHYGVILHDPPSIDRCLEHARTAAEELAKKPPQPGKISGVGIASSFLKTGVGNSIDKSTTRIEWQPHGGVQVFVGAPDIGQGLQTVSAQVAAEALGIDYALVQVAPLTTAISPHSGSTVTSRTTYLVGNSLLKSAQAATNALLDYTAGQLNVPRSAIEYRAGHIYRLDQADNAGIPAEVILAHAAEDDLVIAGEDTATFPIPDDLPKNLPKDYPHFKFCYGAHVARVEIDPELGIVEVTDMVAIHDVGKALHRAGVEGQIEGGVIMSVGYALMEEIKLKTNGRWIDNLTEYMVPTAIDAPRIRSIIVEDAEPTGPFGARGLGEPVAVATAPAIANAVFNALGRRIYRLPISPTQLIQLVPGS